jgi:hypothetical protein
MKQIALLLLGLCLTAATVGCEDKATTTNDTGTTTTTTTPADDADKDGATDATDAAPADSTAK